ncbi:hypothetical protein D3C80_1434810 [compost metagenome]
MLLDRGEQGALFAIIVAPVRGGVERALEVSPFTRRGEQRKPRAHRSIAVGNLVAEAHGEQGRITQVQFGNTVECGQLLAESVDPGMLVLVVCNEAPANIASVVQRTAHVHAQAIAIPITCLSRQQHLLVSGRPLADKVDGRRRVAQPADQACGATHHFHPVIHSSVLGIVVHVCRGRYSVDLEVADGETTGHVGRAVGTQALTNHRHTRGGIEGIGEVIELLVF